MAILWCLLAGLLASQSIIASARALPRASSLVAEHACTEIYCKAVVTRDVDVNSISLPYQSAPLFPIHPRSPAEVPFFEIPDAEPDAGEGSGDETSGEAGSGGAGASSGPTSGSLFSGGNRPIGSDVGDSGDNSDSMSFEWDDEATAETIGEDLGYDAYTTKGEAVLEYVGDSAKPTRDFSTITQNFQKKYAVQQVDKVEANVFVSDIFEAANVKSMGLPTSFTSKSMFGEVRIKNNPSGENKDPEVLNDNAYSTDAKAIIAIANDASKDSGTERLAWSDIVWAQWDRVSGSGAQELNHVVRHGIENIGTKNVIAKVHEDNHIPVNSFGVFTPENPGLNNAFETLLGTDNGRGVVYMVGDWMPGKAVTKILTLQPPNGKLPLMILEIS